MSIVSTRVTPSAPSTLNATARDASSTTATFAPTAGVT
jgi:hypothetical protein